MPEGAISQFSAAELGAAYAAGKLSPVEVAKDHLARIEAFEPQVNAFVHRDADATLAMARASEARWQAGAPLSPIDGVPVTIKDNLAVAGWPNRRGSAVSSATPEAQDCPVADKLRAAGTVFLGKTTMPEYGWKGCADSPLTGMTRNPWDLSTSPGGSSSGAAVCAALNLGCIHLGTDGAGSIRIPAAFTGVFGIKTSFGRVPAYPISTMGVLAHLGPLTRTVRDSALALDVIARPDARDMMANLPPENYVEGVERSLKGLRIGYSPKLGFDVEVDPDIARLTREAVDVLAGLGAVAEEADPGFADPIAPLMTLWSSGAALALANIMPADRAKMDPGLVEIARMGEGISSAAYVDALLYQRNALAMRMNAFHDRFDLLVTPTLPLPAFEAGCLTPQHGRYGTDWTRWTPFTYPFNLTQQPAASVPSGLTQNGLPAGLQIVGRYGADRLVMAVAEAFEKARPFALISAPKNGVKVAR
ncbi:MAG: amidase [Beijerinckiaceae bacterium]|jgi:aspartyl-tRNA(Asn)/glutamyl-tRNA(Gln) amidotransferase subunit A|nr:amidase [Beijerinckiaceae bacterium]